MQTGGHGLTAYTNCFIKQDLVVYPKYDTIRILLQDGVRKAYSKCRGVGFISLQPLNIIAPGYEPRDEGAPYPPNSAGPVLEEEAHISVLDWLFGICDLS